MCSAQLINRAVFGRIPPIFARFLAQGTHHRVSTDGRIDRLIQMLNQVVDGLAALRDQQTDTTAAAAATTNQQPTYAAWKRQQELDALREESRKLRHQQLAQLQSETSLLVGATSLAPFENAEIYSEDEVGDGDALSEAQQQQQHFTQHQQQQQQKQQ
jgi:hypothetical protein